MVPGQSSVRKGAIELSKSWASRQMLKVVCCYSLLLVGCTFSFLVYKFIHYT